jgi:hypothetical protein
MISENSTPKTQARAFSLFGFTGNLGIFLGPLLGTLHITLVELFLGLSNVLQVAPWRTQLGNTPQCLEVFPSSKSIPMLFQPLSLVRLA